MDHLLEKCFYLKERGIFESVKFAYLEHYYEKTRNNVLKIESLMDLRGSLVYMHKIGGIGTTDIVYLSIDNELRLDMFMLPRPCAFQGMEDIEVNIGAIRQQALEIFGKKAGAVLEQKAKIYGLLQMKRGT